MSASKSKTTSNQKTSQTAKTTPDVPSWMQTGQQNYFGQVDALANRGQPVVAGAAPLQMQAFSGASNLGAPQFSFQKGEGRQVMPLEGAGDKGGPQVMPQARGNSVYDLAGALGLGAASAGANTSGPAALAQATGYNPAGQAQTQGYQGQGFTASGPAASQGYGAAGPAMGQGYNASGLTAGQGYNASGLTAGQGYNAATYNAAQGQAGGYQGQGYTASMVNPASLGVAQTNVGPMAQATSRNFTDLNLSGYMNPYTREVQNAYTADFDANAGRLRAQQSAQAAQNGGLRNSNNAVLSALTEGELSRARGSGVAGIRSDGFNTAAGLATGDLNRSAATSQFNTGQTNQGALTQAGINSSRAQLEGQLRSAGLLANQGAANDASRFGADALNRGNEFTAAARNQYGLANMDALNQAGAFNAGQSNQASQFGADARNRAALDFAGRSDAANQFGADAANRAALDFAGRSDAAGQFGAEAANRAALDFAGRSDQAGQFRSDAANRAALDFAGRSDQAGQFGANAQNQASQFGADSFNRASLDAAGRQDQAGAFGADAFNRNGQFNAGAINQNSQFNAGQQDSALMRQLQAAGLMGSLGGQMAGEQRANIGLQAELGGQQRGIETAQQQQEYARLAMLQQLYGINPNAMIGQTVQADGTTNGTTTSREDPGLLGSLGGLLMGAGGVGWQPFGGKGK